MTTPTVTPHEATAHASIWTHDLGLSVRDKGNTRHLLRGVSFGLEPGRFVAVIGSSGCGKSTLIKVLAGVQPSTEGHVLLAGHQVETLRERFPLSLGYLPQFASFHEELTVREIIADALALRLPGSVPAAARQRWSNHLVELAGLRPLLDQRYGTLSGGQRRRIALAEQLVGDPPFLFLDELTSGLDAHSDLEMMRWLRRLAHEHGKTIVLVTHSVKNLPLCDSILYLHRGQLLFHGDYRSLLEVHGAEQIESVLSLYEEMTPEQLGAQATVYQREEPAPPQQPQPLKTAQPPGGLSQLATLARRQWRLLIRDRGTLWLQACLILSFPALVAVFAMDGLPQVRRLGLALETNIVTTLQEQLLYLKESFQAASLVSGLAMFQVILLCLMGANNGAREIAKEDHVLRKELRAGLSPLAYVLTKVSLVLAFSLAQAFWMAWFVKAVCGFPGSFSGQFLVLFAATAALSVTCLAISAGARTPERASLLAIYLVGLQLPLSGAVLALPELLSWLCRPFIAAYWGWSGYLRTLASYRQYDIVKQSTDTTIAGYELCLLLLGLHILLGALLALWMTHRKLRAGL
ncbi:MAG: ATP-binding cassette domain-containing protein [Verrucomicrobiota bacterium]